MTGFGPELDCPKIGVRIHMVVINEICKKGQQISGHSPDVVNSEPREDLSSSMVGANVEVTFDHVSGDLFKGVKVDVRKTHKVWPPS